MKLEVLRVIVASVAFCGSLWLIVHSNVKAPRPSHRDIEPARATHAFEAMRWYNQQRAYPSGTIPEDWRDKALGHIKEKNLQRSTQSTPLLSWTSVGPNNIGGRVRSIAINPLNPNTIYCGSVSGGVWKSTNAGALWFPTNDFAQNLIIGTMVIDPFDTNTIYAGTGEGYFNFDALRGIGVLKSRDGGSTWTVLNNFSTPDQFYSYYYINKLIIRPDNPSTLFAAILGGIWKTTNGGGNWAKLNVPSTTRFCVDLVINRQFPNTMYAAFGLLSTDGIYKTTDGGTSWSKVSNTANGFPAVSTKFQRISLGISRSNPSILYACLADSNNYTHSIQKTTDGGNSWAQVGTPFDPAFNGTHLGGQGWYNNVIAVDPVDPNIVYAGGINLFKSTNGGTSWFRISNGYGSPYVHVDQHAIAFYPSNSSIIYFGNDGGMFKTTNGGASFTEINTNLVTTQFYSGAVYPSAEIYYGGTQDNGTLKSGVLPAWSMVFGGDGGATAVNPNNPSTVYTEYVYLCIQKSTDAGLTWTRTMNGIPTKGPNQTDWTSDRCSFIAPYVMDPSNPQVLVAGTFKVYRTTNGGLPWSAISTDLTGDGDGSGQVGLPGSVISALAIAKTSSATIYVGTSGSATISSRILVTTNTGTSWSNVTTSPLPNRYVTSIAVHPDFSNRAYVTYSGYGTGHVFYTGDRGASWNDVSSNLPDIPVNTIIINPLNTNHLIIGTDLGMFESFNAGGSWTQQNNGLANVSVADLDLREGDLYLFAATHGRGMFKATAPLGTASVARISIAVHQNPFLTQYADLYVVSQSALAAIPTLRVVAGSDSTDIPLSGGPRVYRGSYEFTISGTIILSATATDSLTGFDTTVTRTINVQLLKPGIAGSISSPDGNAKLSVTENVLRDETYFTVATENEQIPSPLVGKAYAIGPVREFSSPILVSLKYSYDMIEPNTEQFLSLYQQTPSGWKPVQSWIDRSSKTVSAHITSLGRIALGYSERSRSQFVPEAYALFQNFPNPFNPRTKIQFTVPEQSQVRLKVFDITGSEVRTLMDQEQGPGRYEVSWDGNDEFGNSVASGVYFYRLIITIGNQVIFTSMNKMMFIK
ncbi:MAG: T9SS type A sorting domain-containing protein [Ignavibacteriae bacterium]|nr:T9SS type A sorting domain-containing protein [Ignavibacteriota bacterium]